MPLEGGLLLAHLHVPQLDRVVPPARGQRLAVRAVRHGPHPIRVSLEGGPQLGLLGGQRRQQHPQAGHAQAHHHPLHSAPIRLHRCPPAVLVILPHLPNSATSFLPLPDTPLKSSTPCAATAAPCIWTSATAWSWTSASRAPGSPSSWRRPP